MAKATTGLGLAFVFGVGCGVGMGASDFCVPPVRAGTHPPRWEYSCYTEQDTSDLTEKANQMGAQGWEIASTAAMSERYWREVVWCFKRPLNR